MCNIIKTYNLKEDCCPASVTLGKVSAALSLSTHWGVAKLLFISKIKILFMK